MSVTTKANGRTRPVPTLEPEPPILGAPPKLRRRPVALLVSVATVVLGSVLGLWVWSAAGTTTEVLAVRTLVHRGEVIDRDDLIVVRVGVDPAVRTVAPFEGPLTLRVDEHDQVVGRSVAESILVELL